MAKTLSELEAKLETLEDAMTSGTLRVKYADREVWYQSVSEMMKARSLLVSKIDKLKNKSRPQRIQACTDKAL